MFSHPCLYAGDFNCHHADWGYDDNSPDGECLAGWASINCLALLYNAKHAASFYFGRWNTGTNTDLTFASVGPNSCLTDRRVLEKFPRSQHRPSLITPPRFAMLQESVLASLLFNIYTYDLPSTISSRFSYADDLALLHFSGNWRDLEGTLSQNMSTLLAYLQTWRLKLSHIKTLTAAFQLNNREAKRELKVYNKGRFLPFCPTPTYLGVKLDRSLTFCHHLVALRKKISLRVTLLRLLVVSGWGADTKTPRITTVSLVYSTNEYRAPVWCCSAHTCLIDTVLNDALQIVTG